MNLYGRSALGSPRRRPMWPRCTRSFVTNLGRSSARPSRAGRVILAPGWSDADPIDPTLTRLYGHVPEMGHRILRVVVSFQSPERCRVVTAFFDRDATEHI